MAFDSTKTEQKDDFKQEPLPEMLPPPEAFVDAPDGKVLQLGSFYSPNFAKGKSGWIQRADGSCEFGDGVFRGRITATSITTNQQEITVETTESIADAITELGSSGGTIRLKAGTYILTDDINIPSNVSLVGQGMGVTVLYFSTVDKGVKAQGTSNYSTGTVTINNGSTALTGAGTAWLTNVTTSHKIRLDNFWYDIASVDGDGAITLANKYLGANLAGVTYDSAIMKSYFSIKDLAVVYSGGNGIYINYGFFFFLDNVASTNNTGSGISINNSSSFGLGYLNCLDNGANGLYVSQIDHVKADVIWTLRNTINGVSLNYVYDCNLGSFISRNNAKGMYCNTIYDTLQSVSDISNNTGIGAEALNCNFYCFISCQFESNGSDGLKLTSDNSGMVVADGVLKNNAGYGLNIAAASVEDTIVSLNSFATNTSGNINDSGTDTLYGVNNGIASTSATAYKNGTTTKNCADADATQNIAHGLGGAPKRVKITAINLPSAADLDHYRSETVYNGTTQSSLSLYAYNSGGGNIYVLDTNFRLNTNTGGAYYNTGVVTVDATNIKIAWTKTNTPSGTYQLLWEASI